MSSEINIDSDNNEACGVNIRDSDSCEYLNENLCLNKEHRIVEEHELSSDNAEEFDTYIEYRKNESAVTQTKEQKQKQNEEIVIATGASSSKVSGQNQTVSIDCHSTITNTNDCEDVHQNNGGNCSILDCKENNNHNHYFIDASSLLDESELYTSPSLMINDSSKPSNSKLTKLKVGETSENQEYKTAEFQKEIKVSNNVESHSDCDIKVFMNIPHIDNVEASSSKLNDGKYLCNDTKFLSNDLHSHTDTSDTSNKTSFVNNKNDLHSIENKKSSFVRSGTFELDIESDETLQRKSNERRQGLLVFQNSIKQFSGHTVDTEPITPHNSIIHINDAIIFNSTTEGPLDSVFYEKQCTKITNNIPDIKNNSKSKQDHDEDEDPNCDNISTSEDPNCDNISTSEFKYFDSALDIKPIKREESIPIISGGVCFQDYEQMRNDNTLCEENLASTSSKIYTDFEESDQQLCKNSIKTAWVVDMSMTEISKKTENNESDPSIQKSYKRSNAKSSLGFYIDLNDIPKENKESKPAISKTESEQTSKKNIFSMYIDFEAPKKEMPSRLSQSLCLKKPDKSNLTEVENNGCEVKNDNGKKSKIDVGYQNGDKEAVCLRGIKISNNIPNRHSWNCTKEYVAIPTSHQRTRSLSGTLNLQNNIVVHDIETDEILEDSIENITDTNDNTVNSIAVEVVLENKNLKEICQIEHDSVVDIAIIDKTNIDTLKNDQPSTINESDPINQASSAKSDGFVSLSDLDKPIPKIVTTDEPVYTRMTRSIPETSWIENKLLMSRSMGCRTSSKLLTNMSTSTPSSIGLSNNTYTKNSGHDSDELVSELSDFSSIQSSTALGEYFGIL